MLARGSAVLFLLALALAACKTTSDEPARTSDPIRAGELGARCAPGGAVDGIDPCGSKDRISLIVTRNAARRHDGLPCELGKAVAATKTIHTIATCIVGGTLYVHADCMMCRMPGAGWDGVAALDELTSAQALALQTRLGLPAASPLQGETAWRQALVIQAEASTSRREDDAATTLVLGSR